MKVFISWSGRRSHEVAEALAEWLRKVIQSAEPWVSSEVERGVKWLDEIGKSLDAHSIGIICVTPGNVEKPWLNFEAGALSKHLGVDGRVIPYLLDFRSASELQQPLGQFNASLANEDGTHDLVKTLNEHSDPKLSGNWIGEPRAEQRPRGVAHPALA
jgi:TIR domain